LSEKIKKLKKRKRVKIPKSVEDFSTNLLIDLKNYSIKIERVADDVEKLKLYGYQIGDNFRMIIKILKENNLFRSVMRKEQI